MTAPLETRRRFLRRAAVVAAGAAGLALGPRPEAPPVATSAPVASTATTIEPVKTTESLVETQSFLNPLEAEAKLQSLAAIADPDTRIAEARRYFDEKFDKSNGNIGVEFDGSVSLGYGPYAITQGDWIAWTGDTIPATDRRFGGEFLEQYQPIEGFNQNNSGLVRITIPGNGGKGINFSTPGRAARLSPLFIPNPNLNFSPELLLRKVYNQGARTDAQWADNAIHELDREFDASGGKIGEELNINGNDGLLTNGRWIVYTNFADPSLPRYGVFKRDGYLTTFKPIYPFFQKGFTGVYGVFQAIILGNGSVHIPTPGRAIKIGTSSVNQRFIPVVNQLNQQ